MAHNPSNPPPEIAAPPATDFDALLQYLKRSRGFDFTTYKSASLTRRILKRMADVEVASFADYLDYLEVHPDEFAHLFNTILINVTSFFRDAAAWEHLAAHELPSLLASKPPDSPIRVWSAGCASGEEAYSAAIVLAEAMGLRAFLARAKIYATDLNEAALNRGRQATYSAGELEAVPPGLASKYFEPTDGAYTFRADLRRCVVFGRHDLVADSPISRIDLLVCRNTLMYLNSETQDRILGRFHYALNPGGILFLGKAEMLLTTSAAFTPIDLKRRFFTKLPRPGGPAHPPPAAGQPPPLPAVALPHGQTPATPSESRLRDAALGSGPAQVVVDAAGALVIANDHARSLFAITDGDIGRPLSDLKMSYHPLDLRSRLDQAYTERVTLSIGEVEWPAAGDAPRFFDITIAPLIDDGDGVLGATIIFSDATATRTLHQALEQANRDRQSAHEELQTTNEELQSTVEELETTNEELQSTNEELETMNEELQSTNEELRTSVEELRIRGDELDGLNSFWTGVLSGLRSAVVVLDSDLRVRVWNARAEDLWGLSAAEVHGEKFFSLDFGLPLEEIRPMVRACLAGEDCPHRAVVQAVNRRGAPFRCQVVCTPLAPTINSTSGATLIMDLSDEAPPPQSAPRAGP